MVGSVIRRRPKAGDAPDRAHSPQPIPNVSEPLSRRPLHYVEEPHESGGEWASSLKEKLEAQRERHSPDCGNEDQPDQSDQSERCTPLLSFISAFILSDNQKEHGETMQAVCSWQRRWLIAPLQENCRFFRPFSKIISEAPLLIVTTWIIWYWCVAPRKAVLGIWLVPICEIFNSFLKQTFRHPRPGWEPTDRVHFDQWSAEYSFPSSDMQLVACCSAYLFPEHPFAVLLTLVIVGVNRLYRGAHYLHDVLVGTGVGILLTWIYVAVDAPGYIESMLKSNTKRALLLWYSLPFCALQYYLSSRAARLSDPKIWEKKANANRGKYQELNTREGHLKQFTGMYGLFVALAIFSPTVDEVNNLPKTTGAFYGRIVVGKLIVIGAFLLIAVLSPKSPSWIMHICRAIRYASVPFVTFFFSSSAFALVGLL
mmetsp:Transcript_15762/g.38867  ORF Transcript_15762/g.38867 Transcript_15762/m.38867 type:complete len:426 (+) Transcript_15762:198-1475(+)